jgi:undecaprenyl diphosphate synthase
LSDAARSSAKAQAPLPQSGDSFEVPRHVAIIMDGNGRWAAERGLPRVAGHRRGVEALRRTVRAATELGISVLTIFSFSSENWSRPPSEIGDLMALLRRFIRKDLAELHESNVRVRVIGEREGLERDICLLLQEAEDLTRGNDGLTLVVAFNYGARQEIARAAQQLAIEVAEGRLSADEISPERLGSYLHAPDIPDPDVIIRTSASPTSCSGRRPIANSFSCRSTGPISTAPHSKARSRNTAAASAASADWSPIPDRDRA